MFFESERLRREDAKEERMVTETFVCSKCARLVEFRAEMDKPVVVTCKHCGRRAEVVIESATKKVA
jgi:transcription elongation factor Elf1